MITARTVAIVGNAPLAEGQAAEIDANDIVVRFNHSPNGLDRTGAKTDILFLANSGKSMQAWLSNPAFMASIVFRNAGRIILPYHPSIIARYHPKPNLLSRAKGRRADWTAQAIATFGAAGKAITVLPPQFYEACCDALDIPAEKRTQAFPSTGFLGINYVLRELDAAPSSIRLYGFSWQGWKRHAWDAEQAWVRAALGVDQVF